MPVLILPTRSTFLGEVLGYPSPMWARVTASWAVTLDWQCPMASALTPDRRGSLPHPSASGRPRNAHVIAFGISTHFHRSAPLLCPPQMLPVRVGAPLVPVAQPVDPCRYLHPRSPLLPLSGHGTRRPRGCGSREPVKQRRFRRRDVLGDRGESGPLVVQEEHSCTTSRASPG